MSIKYYHLAKDEELPEEFCAIRDEGGEPNSYVFYVPESEVAKLRELVQKMMRFFEDGDWCVKYEVEKECDAQEQYEGDCLMRGVFHDRMRELGVEVD